MSYNIDIVINSIVIEKKRVCSSNHRCASRHSPAIALHQRATVLANCESRCSARR